VATEVTSQTAFGVVDVLVSYESQFTPAVRHTGVASEVVKRVTQQPPLHWLPGQQGAAAVVVLPGVPQTTQRFEPLQTVLAALHLLPAQQGCPVPPHGTQVPLLVLVLLQAVPGSRQTTPLVQQACPVPPHSLQT